MTRGVDCQLCAPNSWRWQHKKGCEHCDCDRNGAIGQSCDLYTGQCVCREGFMGRRCDVCAAGHFGYPKCERCNCNRDGSLTTNISEVISCDESGQCTCKSMVIGLKCDTCRPSTFGLSRLNVDGCIKCFCFGRSINCEQSVLSWGQIKMNNKRNLNVDYQNEEYVVVDEFVNDHLIRHETDIEQVNDLSVLPGLIGK